MSSTHTAELLGLTKGRVSQIRRAQRTSTPGFERSETEHAPLGAPGGGGGAGGPPAGGRRRAAAPRRPPQAR
ncbi:hypothetical protein, partial [Nocardia asiatica]|uniref:hypothetical protein n=1 Tax=Nocardia asiatica TaxID=209252 RepID=UPI00245555BE